MSRSVMHCQHLSGCAPGVQAPIVTAFRAGSCSARLCLGHAVVPRLHARSETPFVLRAVPSQSGAAGSPVPPRAGKKKSKKNVDINGEVSKDLGNGMFSIKLENGVTVMAHLSGKIRQNRIKIVGGDHVTVELSPYDLTKGRITYRFRPGEYEALQNAGSAGHQASA